ncbi:MAG: ester cyclase [Blastocatellia bacterium]
MNLAGKNKAVIQRMHEAMDRGGLLAQLDFWAEESLNHGYPSTREVVRAILADIVTTFPDVKLKPIDLVAEGDWVVGRYTFSGTHKGVGRHPIVHEGLLAGVAPTGQRFEVQHIHMFRLKDGLIVEHWASRDDVEMMRQLGLLTPFAASAGK